MRKLILKWLFGTDDVEHYFTILQRDTGLIEDHLNTLKLAKEDVLICRKLIKICKNHGINIDEEMKNIELED